MFRISIRELLLLVALVALTIASLKYVTEGWRTSVYTITMALFTVAAIVAVVDRGRRQASAIGFVLTAGIYWFIVISGPKVGNIENIEFDTRFGVLPTTRITRYFREPVTTYAYYDSNNHELISVDPDGPPPTGMGRVRRRATTLPDPTRTMQIAHCWWALLLGYVGSKIARFVFVRRTSVAP